MLTDLDQMAKTAMQGICASSPGFHMTDQRIAEEAYNLAQAMMAERMRRQPHLGAFQRDKDQP